MFLVIGALALSALLRARATAAGPSIEIGGGAGGSWYAANQVHLLSAIAPRAHWQFGVRTLYDRWGHRDVTSDALSE